MKKTILAVLTVSVVCLAQSSIISTEKCNPDPNPNSIPSGINYESTLPEGWCYNDGYVCQVSTEITGGVRFALGNDPNCEDEVKKTYFETHPQNSDGSVNLNVTSHDLRPYLQEGVNDNVSGLAVALNTAFIINASNEKFMVRIIYHQLNGIQSQNSIRLLSITRNQNLANQNSTP